MLLLLIISLLSFPAYSTKCTIADDLNNLNFFSRQLMRHTCPLFKYQGDFYAVNPIHLPKIIGRMAYKGHVNPYWATFQVGADLIDSEKIENPTPVKMALIEMGLWVGSIPERSVENLSSSEKNNLQAKIHGTYVTNLMFKEFPIGMEAPATLNKVYTSRIYQNLSRIAEDAANKEFWVANMSMGLPHKGYKEDTEESLDKLSSHTLLVVSSGNHYPKPLYSGKTLKNVITVGGTTPDGLPAAISQEGDAVDIYAPGEGVYVNAMNNNVLDIHSGTSFAAPIVSSALAHAMSILESPLSAEVAKELLKRSGTEGYLPHNKKVLNAYRLVRVAQRLKEKGPPYNLQAVQDPALYDFKKETESILEKLNDYLPIDRCDRVQKAHQLLRKAFFLDPENQNTRKKIKNLLNFFLYYGESKFYGPNKNKRSPLTWLSSEDRKTYKVRVLNEFPTFKKLKGTSIKYKMAALSKGILQKEVLPEEYKSSMLKYVLRASLLAKNEDPNFNVTRFIADLAKSNGIDETWTLIIQNTEYFTQDLLQELIISLRKDKLLKKSHWEERKKSFKKGMPTYWIEKMDKQINRQ